MRIYRIGLVGLSSNRKERITSITPLGLPIVAGNGLACENSSTSMISYNVDIPAKCHEPLT